MRVLALVLGTCGLATVATSAVATLGTRGAVATSYATASPGLAVLAVLTTAALLGAATLEAAEGTSASAALATLGLGLAWTADLWAGWSGAPTLLRNAGMLFDPWLPAAVLTVVATLLAPSRARYAAGAAAAVGFAAGLVLWLVRDPFLDRYCWRDCLAHSLAPFPGPELARTATHVNLAVGAACAALAALVAAAAVVRGALPWQFLAASAAGVALLTSELVLRFEPAERPTRPLFGWLEVGRGVTLLALAAALGWHSTRPRFVRRAISRLAAGGGIAEALGEVGYPLADGTVVDAEGEPITLGPATRIVRGGEVVALIRASRTAHVERALGPAARLALANERLRAEQLYRLRELTELRRRIITTGDVERRRLERDLHDGAQQRLLTLALDLRVAVKHAELAGRTDAASLLRKAAERIDEATHELREIAHGIFPTTLATSGLAAALQTLADTRRLVLSIEIGARRYPAPVEIAAYALVAEATAGAPAIVRVHVRENDSALVVTLYGDSWNGVADSAEERIGAAGGAVTWGERQVEAVLPV